MMILSNCLYVRAQVVPRLLDCFRSHGYPPSKEVENVCTYLHDKSFLFPFVFSLQICSIMHIQQFVYQVVLEDLKRLDDQLFKAYIGKKIEPIEEILAEALDVENFDYDRNTLLKGKSTQ